MYQCKDRMRGTYQCNRGEGGATGDRKDEGGTPQGVFNPTDTQYEVAMGRLLGHKVQRCYLDDIKSDQKWKW